MLYPDGVLPLKVFEQRYIEMTKACLRDERPFGVCLIREGREVGTAAVPEPVGCLATIESWDMPQLGLFHLVARGGGRFRIRETRVAPNHLISATVEPIPPDDAAHEVDRLCREVLQAIIEKVGAERFPAPAATRRRRLGRLPAGGNPAARRARQTGAAGAHRRRRAARAAARRCWRTSKESLIRTGCSDS